MIHQAPLPELLSREWDTCIIGSGALGIAMGLALSRAGQSVLVIEAGGEDVTEESQRFYACQSIGHPHGGSSDGRFRVFGGSTERWGGQAMQFDPIDFEPRPNLHPEGWPISRAELADYYSQAEAMMGVAGADYHRLHAQFSQQAMAAGVPATAMAETSAPFQFHHSVFTSQPRLRERYRDEIGRSEKLHVLQNSPAFRLISTSGSEISGLEIRANGAPAPIRAGTYILACGCIENVRFLLLQRELYGLSALDALPQLGRCMQDHPGAHLGEIHFQRGAFLQDLFRLKLQGTISYKARISWSDEYRRLSGHPAVSGTLLMMRRASEFEDRHPRSWLARHRHSLSPRHWIKALQLASRGIPFSPLHHTYLAVSAEDVRDPDSRISLSEAAKDAFGEPLATIDWKVSEKVATSIIAYLEAFEHFLTSYQLGTLGRFQFTRDAGELLKRLKDNAHHIGATSMASCPSGGVVDRDLKVFGMRNLYIAGTSVLPTGSHANPTLTALALGLRLADHLIAGR